MREGVNVLPPYFRPLVALQSVRGTWSLLRCEAKNSTVHLVVQSKQGELLSQCSANAIGTIYGISLC